MNPIQCIIQFSSCFHDGSLISIKHSNDNITLQIESGKMFSEQMDVIKNSIDLSPNFTIKGNLHLIGISNLIANEKTVEMMEFSHDSCEIMDINITMNHVELNVSWIDYPPKNFQTYWVSYEMEVESLLWENRPFS